MGRAVTGLELDVEHAGRHIVASLAWGDAVDRRRHDHRRDIDALDLADGGSRVADLLAQASDELWTVAEFVRLLVERVVLADRLAPSTLDVDALLATARQRVEVLRPARDRIGEAFAYDMWLRSADRDDLRRRLEERHGTDVARVLERLGPNEAIAYWAALTDDERRDLLRSHPEVVALRVLAHDPHALTVAQIDAIADGNRFPVATTTVAASFDLDVGVRVIELAIGAGLTAIITRLSDGRVEMTVLADVTGGVEAGLAVPELATASITGGLASEVEQRFAFADEAGAAAAFETLRRAAQQDASFGGLLRHGSGVAWNALLVAPNPAFGGISPSLVFRDPLPTLPTYDLTPEVVVELRDLWTTNGVVTTERIGAFGEATADFTADLQLVEASLDARAETRLLAYDTSAGPLATGGGRVGVMWSGHVDVDAHGFVDDALGPVVGDVVPVGGGQAGTELGFVVDIAQPAQGATFAEITLTGGAAAGAAVELLDVEVADATLVDHRADHATAVVRVPIDPSTQVDLALLTGALARGRLPAQPLRRLGEAAEVDITTTSRTTTEGEAALDLGAVSAEATVTTSIATTTVALHRRPGGSLYARRDVDDAVDRARAQRR